jgi:hypothetical protein
MFRGNRNSLASELAIAGDKSRIAPTTGAPIVGWRVVVNLELVAKVPINALTAEVDLGAGNFTGFRD